MTAEAMAHDLRAYADWCIAHYEDVPPTIVNDLNAAAALIEQQAAKIEELEEKIPRWIPVAERLPEVEGKYIVCTAHGSVTTVRFDPVLGRFQRIFTHWMPLPEGPEG